MTVSQRLSAPIGLSLFWLSFTGDCVSAQEAEANPDVRKLVNQYEAGRAKLVRGMYRCTGTRTETRPTGSIKFSVSLFSAFDYSKEKLRFDRAERAEKAAPAFKDIPTSFAGKYVRTTEHSIHWLPDEERVIIRTPGVESWTDADPFDVRAIGVAGKINLLQNQSLSQILDGLRRFPTLDRDGETARLRITRTRENSDHTHESIFAFDTTRGCVPVRVETVRRSAGKAPLRIQLVRTDWKEVNGVMVPERVRFFSRLQPGDDRFSREDWRFEWLRVNEPIPEVAFEPRGMGLPVGTEILVAESDMAHRIGEIGDDRNAPVDPTRDQRNNSDK